MGKRVVVMCHVLALSKWVPEARTTQGRIPCLGLLWWAERYPPKCPPPKAYMPLYGQKELCRGDEGKDLEMRRLFWAPWVVRYDHRIRIRGKQEVQSQREEVIRWQK